MQLSELKLISASNIIKLRTEKELTQAELGAKLNYSDKTISKWERGEAIPDAYVLLQMAEIFGVSVDYLLSNHDSWEAPKDEAQESTRSYSVNVIISIAVIAVMTVALTVFVTMWLLDIIEWRVFIVGGSIAILTYMILDCVFKKARHLQFALAAFVMSIFVILYVFVPLAKPWQLFLIAIPAEIIVFLSCNIRKKPTKPWKKGTK